MNERRIYPSLSDVAGMCKPITELEANVLDYFVRNIPKSWEIYIRPHLNGLVPDFVLLNPERGIAIYEVVDWDIASGRYFVMNGHGAAPVLMMREGGLDVQIEHKNPIPKIDLYKDEIYTLYCPRLPKASGFGVIVSGVIFPRSSREQAEKLLFPIREHHGHTGYSSLYPIIGSDTLADSRSWSVKKFVLPSVDRVDSRIDESCASDLRKWLLPPSLGDGQAPLFSISNLSPNQKRIVTTRTNTGYRRVRGPAGSGKTLVLAGRAAQIASEGKNVLVITFNITLINYISELTNCFSQGGTRAPQITALNFHFWCKRISQVTGHYTDYQALWSGNANAQQVLKIGMASAALDWLKDLEEVDKWDAILVDEGQDIELSWWKSLRQALRHGGEALLCADKIQNIYEVPPWTDDEMTGAGFRGAWGTLDESYRLSPALCTLAKQFINDFLPDLDDQRPEPIQMGFEFKTILKWWQVEHRYAAHACVDALLDVIKESEMPIERIDLTCLVANDDIGLEVVQLLREKGIQSIDTFGAAGTAIEKYYESQRKKLAFFSGKGKVKVTTLHSFKGWESSALVVHIGRADSQAALSLAYAGLTRLKKDEQGCYLTIVNEAPELRKFGVDWKNYKELDYPA